MFSFLFLFYYYITFIAVLSECDNATEFSFKTQPNMFYQMANSRLYWACYRLRRCPPVNQK